MIAKQIAGLVERRIRQIQEPARTSPPGSLGQSPPWHRPGARRTARTVGEFSSKRCPRSFSAAMATPPQPSGAIYWR